MTLHENAEIRSQGRSLVTEALEPETVEVSLIVSEIALRLLTFSERTLKEKRRVLVKRMKRTSLAVL